MKRAFFVTCPDGTVLNADDIGAVKATNTGLLMLDRSGNPTVFIKCLKELAEQYRDEIGHKLRAYASGRPVGKMFWEKDHEEPRTRTI